MNDNKNNILNSLKVLGLTEYESSCYLALNYIISGTATEISENANVPRSRVYDVLKPLVRRGFIEVNKGRPLKYTVVPPKDIFKSNKNKLIEKLENAEIELNEIYENQLSKVPAPVWLIHGQEKIIKKELEIISRGKNSINMRIGFLFPGELDILKPKIGKKIKQGVEVNIIVSSKYFTKKNNIDILEELKPSKANVVKSPLPMAKMIVRDGKELMHVFSKFQGRNKKIIPDTAIGIWNQYEDIAKNYDERFETIWNKKRKNNENIKK
ncbi:sugar-specific transcriptional regulator TrmB [Methanobrevibacter cuticularis]|uniref:Sugar-specific transcriptional regulator TrmB n=1 Tax=Methanobrevibacter cuticularis TaxID=47311 RepID=A0A166CLN5_9EURY|nr:helix-turn-helix domain-containing protein [Methanobrevibacter cuticularis]KZX14641.1 sugar-specific transcriptional regulator TrmB [Methanobrevibacter cuticularis]